MTNQTSQPEQKPNTETLKQEKEWLIDAEKGLIYYDCSNDVEAGWWLKIKTKPIDTFQDDVKIET